MKKILLGIALLSFIAVSSLSYSTNSATSVDTVIENCDLDKCPKCGNDKCDGKCKDAKKAKCCKKDANKKKCCKSKKAACTKDAEKKEEGTKEVKKEEEKKE